MYFYSAFPGFQRFFFFSLVSKTNFTVTVSLDFLAPFGFISGLHVYELHKPHFSVIFYIKNEFHDIIYIFKNYFVTVFLVFNCIQMDPYVRFARFPCVLVCG